VPKAGAVQSALGDPQATRALSASTAAPSRKRDPKPKTAAAPAIAAASTSEPRQGKRVRRSAEQIDATANKIHAFVKANPNTNAETIKNALSIAKNEWLTPLAVLTLTKRLVSTGQNATTYSARGRGGCRLRGAGPRTQSAVETAAPVGNGDNRASTAAEWDAPSNARLPPLSTGAWKTPKRVFAQSPQRPRRPFSFLFRPSRRAEPCHACAISTHRAPPDRLAERCFESC